MLAVAIVLLGSGCHPLRTNIEPSVEFTRIPFAGEGAPDRLDIIEGRVRGVQSNQRVVIYARAGVWWVQPFAIQPFTSILPDFTWKSTTHPGTEYAALLVDSGYSPPLTTKVLPEKGGKVLAVATAEGVRLAAGPAKSLRFSGFDWGIRQTPNHAGGSNNVYDPSNAWVDKSGLLHLRVSKHGAEWTNSEVTLPQSLGYGNYIFWVQDISRLEPAAVLNLSIWDNSAPPRELDIEISRWGEPTSKNAQYVVQPYYLPENSVRFMAPAGSLVYSIHWEPNQVSFETARRYAPVVSPDTVKHYDFTSGIPSPGNDSIHMNFYAFANPRNPLRQEAEVVIEKFEFLP